MPTTYTPTHAGDGLKETRRRDAEETARHHGYASYQAMIDDPGVGAVEARRRVEERHPVDGRLRASIPAPFGSPLNGLPGDPLLRQSRDTDP